MSWAIEGPDGRLLGSVGDWWKWIEAPGDDTIRMFDTRLDALDFINILPWRVRKRASPIEVFQRTQMIRRNEEA